MIGGDWLIKAGITEAEQLEVTAALGVIQLRRRQAGFFGLTTSTLA
nr:hypothetical protein [Serratia plymuthica]